MDVAALLPIIFLSAVFGLLFAGCSVAFTLAGGSLLFAVIANAFGLFDLRLLQALPSRIYSLFSDDTLVSVPLFVLMGTILDRTKVAAELLETMGYALRRIPGGIGVSVCLVGALLGASTGVIGATVVTMALISLPAMLRHGYPVPLACGLICASGALTQVIPPATVLILLGDQIGNAYAEAQRAIGKTGPSHRFRSSISMRVRSSPAFCWRPPTRSISSSMRRSGRALSNPRPMPSAIATSAGSKSCVSW